MAFRSCPGLVLGSLLTHTEHRPERHRDRAFSFPTQTLFVRLWTARDGATLIAEAAA